MMVQFPTNGTTTDGYLAVPESGAGPGVIVFQEWWGLVDHIKDVCDRLAASGFTALAPDMYHGDCTTDPDEAGRLMMALDVPKAAADAAGAIAYLQAHAACSGDRVGVMGFCLGGQLALYSACENSATTGACVNYYGVHPNIRPDVAALDCPVLGLFAERDGFVTGDVVESLAASLRDADKSFDFKTYPDVDHAFFNDTRPDVYAAAAADDAWLRTIDFLRANIG
jgi:carboxymethylenebutenolidase